MDLTRRALAAMAAWAALSAPLAAQQWRSLTDEGKASPLGVLEGLRVLNWHGDTFDLPSGATRLASTPLTPNQAFTYGSNVLALQFHVELAQHNMERWLIGHTLELAKNKVDLARMRENTARYAPATNEASRKLFNTWLDGVGA